MSDVTGAVAGRLAKGPRRRARLVLTCIFVNYGAVIAAGAGLLASPSPAAAEARDGGLAATVLGISLVAFAATASALLATGARLGGRLRRLEGTGRCAQGVLVPALAAAGGFLAWHMRARGADPAPASLAELIGGITLVAAFPALVAERFVAALPAPALPEAPGLRRVLALPVLFFLLAGAAEAARGEGFAAAGLAASVLAVAAAAVAAELTGRALLRWFQPPRDPEEFRAPVSLLLADLAGMRASGGSPLRTHFGLDFSRSWAMAFLRRALLPAAALTGALCWALSGVTLVPLDGRGIYERFGRPVQVFGPGLHVALPWPLGRVRNVELGVVHSVPLSDVALTFTTPPPAEDAAPRDADRLWDQVHPSESDWLIAGSGAGGQSFEVMSADVRVLFRVGLTDADALHAYYGVADADTLVREAAGQVMSRFFAARTLDSMLDERLADMDARLRAALAAVLPRDATGLEIVDVVVEAVHPPAGAAVAYHNVQAAQILANASIAAETGRAKATASTAREQAWSITDKSRASAAETLASARSASLSFDGERAANAVGGRAFLLERYLSTISTALARSPLTIIDHRVDPGRAPIIDLRPLAAAAKATGVDDSD